MFFNVVICITKHFFNLTIFRVYSTTRCIIILNKQMTLSSINYSKCVETNVLQLSNKNTIHVCNVHTDQWFIYIVCNREPKIQTFSMIRLQYMAEHLDIVQQENDSQRLTLNVKGNLKMWKSLGVSLGDSFKCTWLNLSCNELAFN